MGQPVDLAETIKTLLHLNQEHGHVTYDDINDILPDGLSPNDLDELVCRVDPHAHVVLHARRRWDRLDRRRERSQPVLRDERGRGVLRDHEA